MEESSLHKLNSAGLGVRLLAALYDWLLVLAIYMVMSVPLVALQNDAITPGNNLYRVSLVIVAGIFFVGFWARGGQTLGMRAWRLQLVSDDGTAVHAGQACARYASAWVSAAALGCGFWWALFNPQKRAWHDSWSGSRLVVRPKPDA